MSASCGYQGHEFGAHYPDSLCIEGYLWDADSCDGEGGLTSGGEIPCPSCNTAAHLEHIREQIQELIDPDTPQPAVWEFQLRRLIEINEAAALDALATMPRHVFWIYKRDDSQRHADVIAESCRTWPWRVPHLSAHQNIRILSAASNPPGDDPEGSTA